MKVSFFLFFFFFNDTATTEIYTLSLHDALPIAILRRLLAGGTVTYEGRFYQLQDVAVGPAMRSPLCLWSAGGRQLPHAASPERPVLAPAVLRRIVASDGWIARPTSLPSQISEDLA